MQYQDGRRHVGDVYVSGEGDVVLAEVAGECPVEPGQVLPV